MKKKYKICKRCIMDNSAKSIRFDSKGICNFCTNYLNNRNKSYKLSKSPDALNKLINKIKIDGKGKDYDCLIGLSGGMDSSYLAYEVKRLGLRPLAVHVDNSWNEELAVANIEKLVNKLNIDLITEVLDWQEITDLQYAFLKSSTTDIDLPTDHANRSVLLKTAHKYKIKYILNGRQFSTEGILPIEWSYGPFDWKYMKNIHKLYGRYKISKYPHIRIDNLIYYYLIDKVRDVQILDYLDYSREKALYTLQKEIGWKNYRFKHSENLFTKFFQGYILPKKFNIDKRRAHYSVLVSSGQITREEALRKIKENIYEEKEFMEDKELFLKKIKMKEIEFEEILKQNTKTYKDYKNNAHILFPKKGSYYYKVFKFLSKFSKSSSQI